jgi:hypothetical protein
MEAILFLLVIVVLCGNLMLQQIFEILMVCGDFILMYFLNHPVILMKLLALMMMFVVDGFHESSHHLRENGIQEIPEMMPPKCSPSKDKMQDVTPDRIVPDVPGMCSSVAPPTTLSDEGCADVKQDVSPGKVMPDNVPGICSRVSLPCTLNDVGQGECLMALSKLPSPSPPQSRKPSRETRYRASVPLFRCDWPGERLAHYRQICPIMLPTVPGPLLHWTTQLLLYHLTCIYCVFVVNFDIFLCVTSLVMVIYIRASRLRSANALRNSPRPLIKIGALKIALLAFAETCGISLIKIFNKLLSNLSRITKQTYLIVSSNVLSLSCASNYGTFTN